MLDLRKITIDIEQISFKFVDHSKIFGIRVQSVLIQKIIFSITLIGLFTSWTLIQTYRYAGLYYDSVCQRFEIIFDDYSIDYFNDHCNVGSNCPASWIGRTDSIRYTSFNDVYEAVRDQDGTVALYNQRPVYTQRGLTGTNAFGTDSPPGKIFYCIQEEAWVFTIEGVDKGVVDQNDGGCNWLMKSLQTDAYSLHEVDTTGWIVWTGLLDVVKDFSISCVECTGNDVELDIGCTYHGRCVNEKCVCDSGWIGSQCETCASCSELDFYNVTSQGVTRYRRFDDQSSNIPGNVYGRPIYFQMLEEFGNANPDLILIIYDGERYVAWDLTGDINATNETTMTTFFQTFHSTWDFTPGTKVLFVSEKTNAPMPFGLLWTNDLVHFSQDSYYSIDVICPEQQERDVCRFVFN